jgi:hypothetical protein
MAIFGRKFRGGASSTHMGSGRMDFPHAQPVQPQPSSPAKPTWSGSSVYHEDMSGRGAGDSKQRHEVNRYSDGSASIKTFQSGTQRRGSSDAIENYDREVASYKVGADDWGFDSKKNTFQVKGTKGFPIKQVVENDFNPSVEKDW